MTKALSVVFLVVVAACAASAQTPTGIAVVDSASVARTAWARAGIALQRNDSAAARFEIAHAAAAWPAQSSYLWARAVFAARARDTIAAIDALRSYAALGLGRNLSADNTFTWLNELPAFGSVRAAHDANRGVQANSRPVAVIPDSTFWPEGMDFDSTTQRYYVASVAHGTIAELRPDGHRRIIRPVGRKPIASLLGVRVDARRGVLWATTSSVPSSPYFRPADSSVAALLRIRIGDGVVERRWDLPPIVGGHVLGDLAVGPSGDVFVTDSNEPVLYRLRPGADSLEPVRSPLFRSLQGLAPSPNGKSLYLSDYSHGILRVDLASGAVVHVREAPYSTSLGCDGIAWDRGAIVAVQNGVTPARIMRFVLDASGDAIARAELIDRNWSVADEPTIGAVVGGKFVYVANSQWEKYGDGGKRDLSRPLTGPILLAAPLPRP